ncbi:MAG: alpha/beta hydrolase [Hyphomicrobium sp.]|uniref:alpha/beta fold hydrolase n=1 Tax=Hyphomicrobium sp. TaxID=82 RepID=UPI0013292247|nr:alpha/beta hydrolase [Hyphomicrobium sp.]KAB2942838.1 MAG: alpha/beta hydrolase [Hyphomicrobium sp.]MBZ0211900.1 alpha/beta hydrolase [Hyphomicrobium sp.]MCZ7596336.1 alpha/beta hydrolase [Hyphomicrobium sp.]
MTSGEAFEDIYYTSRDGLRLHARRYPAAGGGSRARPALCLAGLTRNGRDFHDLAVALSRRSNNPRTVYTLDYRGRGLSDFDPDWRNYAVHIEMLDVLDFITLAGLHNAALIGTSRGGLITMLIAAAQPTAIGAAVLNDIGPVIEHEGLARISGYVGRVPLPISWADAARMVRELNRRHFPEVSDAVWEEAARQWYNEKNGKPAPGYDPNLGNALSVLDGPLPALWPQFEALKRVPLMVLRGENSDILTAETVDEMRRRHPAMATITVANQGHAPLLKDTTSIEAIRHFLTATDAGREFATLASVPA